MAPPLRLSGTCAGPSRGRRALAVVAATTPRFKSTKHHRKSRPKKTTPSQRDRKPATYEPLPPPPPQFEVVSKADEK